MTTDTSTSPWTTAAEHCWAHVRTVTAVQDVIDKLKDIPVEAVVPVISSIGPSIIVTPYGHADREACRLIASQIKNLLGTAETWHPIPMGDNWSLRLRVESGVQVHIATTIPVAKPTEFKL